MTTSRRFTFPAPRRNTIELPSGRYITVPWTPRSASEYMKVGGWFNQTGYDFAPQEVVDRMLAAAGVSTL